MTSLIFAALVVFPVPEKSCGALTKPDTHYVDACCPNFEKFESLIKFFDEKKFKKAFALQLDNGSYCGRFWKSKKEFQEWSTAE